MVAEFQSNVSSRRGCIMLAICRGKVSEGLDFAGNNARGVLITGLPYPPKNDARIVIKQRTLNEPPPPGVPTGSRISGSQWYGLQASQAVNQAVGRVIRNRNDYGSIIFLDERFRQEHQRNQLSMWLRSFWQPTDYDTLKTSLSNFFHKTTRDPRLNGGKVDPSSNGSMSSSSSRITALTPAPTPRSINTSKKAVKTGLASRMASSRRTLTSNSTNLRTSQFQSGIMPNSNSMRQAPSNISNMQMPMMPRRSMNINNNSNNNNNNNNATANIVDLVDDPAPLLKRPTQQQPKPIQRSDKRPIGNNIKRPIGGGLRGMLNSGSSNNNQSKTIINNSNNSNNNGALSAAAKTTTTATINNNNRPFYMSKQRNQSSLSSNTNSFTSRIGCSVGRLISNRFPTTAINNNNMHSSNNIMKERKSSTILSSSLAAMMPPARSSVGPKTANLTKEQRKDIAKRTMRDVRKTLTGDDYMRFTKTLKALQAVKNSPNERSVVLESCKVMTDIFQDYDKPPNGNVGRDLFIKVVDFLDPRYQSRFKNEWSKMILG
eukprot:TRINITY_DN53611_c0_g3_i2.p1 TRINITY_DN53611_c0_g3~~TRINITY_DN53611_c0_g3_i2.p1  ORF type:complete len:545 (+),score=144.32 TRINITY_DN53611_c0_g3_i2:389-2023(+)